MRSTNKEYDSVLAKKLNADPYGMKKYYLVLLKTGPANITDKAEVTARAYEKINAGFAK